MKPRLEEGYFRALLEEHLLPLFPSITLGPTQTSTEGHSPVAYANGKTTVYVKPDAEALFRVPLNRSQRFSESEHRLIHNFVSELSELTPLLDSTDESMAVGERYANALLSGLPAEVISRQVGWKTARHTIARAIRIYEELSAQTYEGKPITCAVGITSSIGNGIVRLKDITADDCGRVLSNGYDTILLAGSDGRVFDLKCLPLKGARDYAPYRFGAIANWVEGARRRIAVVLTRTAELLVFSGSDLVFAKRRGQWSFFSHHAAVQRLGVGIEKGLREAIYKSCLDTSFSRTGACICVIRRRRITLLSKYVNDKDLLKLGMTTKSRYLNKVVGRKFQSLDRRLRQELLSLDGATVLDNRGEILAAGAIVEVPKGSEGGGGRRAAAIALSNLGIAVKVSADGPITAFRDGDFVLSVGGPPPK